MLELGELGARERDPPLIRAEVDEHGVVFHATDDAEPVLVMCHLIACRERLRWGRRSRGLEWAARQVAPGRGAGCLHCYIMRLPCPAAGGPAAGLRSVHTMISGGVASVTHGI